jgi:hypothetical protein
MPISNLSAFGSLPPPRTVFVNNNQGQQQQLSTTGGVFEFSLRPTQYQLIPAGQYMVLAGQYSNVQVWDQQSYMWRFVTGFDQVPYVIQSDGTNYRLCNTTGGVVGAVVTGAGSGMTNGFYGYNAFGQAVSIIGGATTLANSYLTVTASAGGSTYNVFVGGGIASVVTPATTAGASSFAGSGYTAAPNIIVTPPPTQGAQPFIPATLTCVITAGGLVGAITVVNAGAGYVAAPTITIVNAQGDTTGAGAYINAGGITLTTSGAIQAITVASPGAVNVAGTGLASVPTLTIAGTVAAGAPTAATIPNLTIRAVATIATAGVAYGNALPVNYITVGGAYGGAAPVNTNPAIEFSTAAGVSSSIMNPVVPAQINGSCAAGGTITTIPTVSFAGFGYASVPTLTALPTGANALTGCTLATFTLTMGGQTDTVYLYTI